MDSIRLMEYLIFMFSELKIGYAAGGLTFRPFFRNSPVSCFTGQIF